MISSKMSAAMRTEAPEAEEYGPHPLTPFSFGDGFVPENGKNRL
jgi:hypothetical protein